MTPLQLFIISFICALFFSWLSNNAEKTGADKRMVTTYLVIIVLSMVSVLTAFGSLLWSVVYYVNI